MGLLDRLRVPLSWLGVIRRTSQRTLQDNCLGLAAELAYFFFLALFPALLFFVALASFFPIDRLTDHVLGALDRFTPPDVLGLIRDQPGLAILLGAEMNAVIEHASPMGKDPGEKVPGGGTG